MAHRENPGEPSLPFERFAIPAELSFDDFSRDFNHLSTIRPCEPSAIEFIGHSECKGRKGCLRGNTMIF